MIQLMVISVLLFGQCFADIYLHIPRGSNNRLNEKTGNRKNANRVFDSQNNNKGGYNVGDKGENPSNNEGEQYRMKYFQSGPFKSLNNDAGKSFLELEWTNQHGCGGNEDTSPQKQNCHMILQYMCQDDVNMPTGTADTLRNGQKTDTQAYNRPQSLTETQAQTTARKNNAVQQEEVLQEPWEWYDKCFVRERNRGLFTADQKLKTNNGLGTSSAIYTRENPNGNRYGYECPEERDYFPYWHPTPWKDIAVLAENASMCSYYKSKSFNTQMYHECVEFYTPGGARRPYSKWNNQAQCTQNGGQWIQFSNFLEKAPAYTTEAACNAQSKGGLTYRWAVPYDATSVTKKECLVQLDQPDCKEAQYSRSNHLGNGANGRANSYMWTLPYFPSAKAKRCVFRMRYNISTDDYDPYFTDSSSNQQLNPFVQSIIEQDPYIDVGGRTALRMNINTDQTGRQFQDRSHVFLMSPRAGAISQTDRIFNLNVRGKRGNIVQTYPAVEYDFHPNTLNMKPSDLVHIQWTGSNTHNNNNPAGDGQAGDEGQGKDGSDRSNIVEIKNLNDNFPLPYESTSMWSAADVKWIYSGSTAVSPKDLAVIMSSSGYYKSVNEAKTKAAMNPLLNNAPASFEGAVLKFNRGTYHYMSTRNNNFSNRSQKSTLIVS